jgi:hypothetical protein
VGTDSTAAEDLARMSAALIAAVAEAKVRIERGDFDDEFVELVRHAREMYAIMRETLIADATAGAYARGLLEAIGNNLDSIEASMRAGHA